MFLNQGQNFWFHGIGHGRRRPVAPGGGSGSAAPEPLQDNPLDRGGASRPRPRRRWLSFWPNFCGGCTRGRRSGRAQMVTTPTLSDDHLTAARRAKLAYIYVRQSSLTQVKQHQESTELQYRLVERAEAWGWPRERIHVIDEDLGKSGAGTAERSASRS